MQNGEIKRENKMGVMPMGRLIWSMSLPMMLSMLTQALYNIVDSLYLSHIPGIGEQALSAVSLAFPAQTLMIAFGVGTSVGTASLLSRSLGAKDFDEANRAAANGLFLAAVTCAVFMILGLCFGRLFFQMQTDDPVIAEGGGRYLTICMAFSFGIFGQTMLERLLQSTGRTVLSMVAQLTGAVINIILDPVFIFGFGMIPALGIAGAAIATVLGQIAAMVLALLFNIFKNPEIQIRFRGFRPNGGTIRRIYQVGAPSIVMQSIGSVMSFGMNQILLTFSTTATAIFGVYFKLQSFAFMPVFGLNSGLVPIVAYNFGARKPERMISAIRLSVMIATAIMCVGVLAFEAFPAALLGFFNPSESMLQAGVPALRIIGVHFLFAGFCIVAGSVFQAVGSGMYSLWVSLIRQMLVLLPAAYLLSLTGALRNVWFAFPIAEVASVIVSSALLYRTYVTKIRPLQARGA